MPWWGWLLTGYFGSALLMGLTLLVVVRALWRKYQGPVSGSTK